MSEFLAALVVTCALTAVAVRLLRRAQFMDVPNHRSSHSTPIPRGGGVAVVLTLVVGTLILVDLTPAVIALVVVTLVLGSIGLVDDLRSLPSLFRLGAQAVGAATLATVMLLDGDAAWFLLPILTVAVAGYVNAYNFMDGINGISAGTALVAGLFWAWAGGNQGVAEIQAMGLLLAGAALGFLPWNAPRAKVFLGDVGSYGIGLFIVGLSALALTRGIAWHWCLAPLLVYGADTGWVLLKRFRGGRSLTQAHREHVYQRVVDAGWSHSVSALLCAGASALVCLLAGAVGAWWFVPGAIMVCVVYLAAPTLQRQGVSA